MNLKKEKKTFLLEKLNLFSPRYFLKGFKQQNTIIFIKCLSYEKSKCKLNVRNLRKQYIRLDCWDGGQQ